MSVAQENNMNDYINAQLIHLNDIRKNIYQEIKYENKNKKSKLMNDYYYLRSSIILFIFINKNNIDCAVFKKAYGMLFD
jgi:hypothetical protein